MPNISMATLRLVTRTAPDVETILRNFRREAEKSGSLAPAEALRMARRLDYRRETTLRFVDALTLCHGVESFESIGGFYSYANAGDTYAETVILYPSGKFRVASIGDILEQASHMRWHARREGRAA